MAKIKTMVNTRKTALQLSHKNRLPIQLCDFEFTCILNRTCVNYVQFKWLRGDNKDNLHQIIQYLKNQAARLSNIHAWTDGKKQEDTNQLL